MTSMDDARERLKAAQEEKALSEHPGLKRVYLRACVFLALQAILGWIVVAAVVANGFDVERFLELVVIGLLTALTFNVVHNYRKRNWAILEKQLKVSVYVFWCLAAVAGFRSLLAGNLIGFLAVAVMLIWANDFRRGQSDLAAMREPPPPSALQSHPVFNCPNCGAVVNENDLKCAACPADFSDPNGWKPSPR